MLLRDDEVIRAEMILRAEGPASRIARWMGARDPGRRTAKIDASAIDRFLWGETRTIEYEARMRRVFVLSDLYLKASGEELIRTIKPISKPICVDLIAKLSQYAD